MSNVSELLNNLKKPLNRFDELYDAFIKTCTNSEYFENIKQTPEFNALTDVLQNKYVVPLLVEKLLLEGAPYFHECNLRVYDFIYQHNNDMLLSYTTIAANQELESTYLDNGADVSAFAITTAQHWQMQQEKNLEILGFCDCGMSSNGFSRCE